MRPNKIKQMWQAGQCATLGWLSVAHGFTAEMGDVLPMLQAISQTDTVPFVRVA